jgi:hypothetical protein
MLPVTTNYERTTDDVIRITDNKNTKRRLFISTASRETKNTGLHVTLPLLNLRREAWLNLCFDIKSLVQCEEHNVYYNFTEIPG